MPRPARYTSREMHWLRSPPNDAAVSGSIDLPAVHSDTQRQPRQTRTSHPLRTSRLRQIRTICNRPYNLPQPPPCATRIRRPTRRSRQPQSRGPETQPHQPRPPPIPPSTLSKCRQKPCTTACTEDIALLARGIFVPMLLTPRTARIRNRQAGTGGAVCQPQPDRRARPCGLPRNARSPISVEEPSTGVRARRTIGHRPPETDPPDNHEPFPPVQPGTSLGPVLLAARHRRSRSPVEILKQSSQALATEPYQQINKARRHKAG